MRLILVILVASASVAQAAPSPIQVKPGSIAKGSRKASFAGGEATSDLSLIDATTSAAADGSETLALFYGSERGQKLKGLPGFFQMALDRDGKRLSIDLAQVIRTAIDPEALRKKLRASKLVTMLDMTMDPSDSSTNITLLFKAPVEIAVRSSDSTSPSSVSITMKQASGGKK